MLDCTRLEELRSQYPQLTDYEIEREERIKSNHAIMGMSTPNGYFEQSYSER